MLNASSIFGKMQNLRPNLFQNLFKSDLAAGFEHVYICMYN